MIEFAARVGMSLNEVKVNCETGVTSDSKAKVPSTWVDW